MIRKRIMAKKFNRRQFLKSTAAAGVLATTLSAKHFVGFAQSDMPQDLLDAVANESGELNIYNWSDYIDEDTIPQFEQEFGIKVNYTTFEDNEEMIAAVKADPGVFDLSVPTQDAMFRMRTQNLIQTMNTAWLTNTPNLSAQFLNPEWDPNNEYFIPWQWGTTGIAYNSALIDDPRADGWALLFDGAADYNGRITMLNEKKELVSAPLKYLGFSLNTEDLEEIEQTRAILLDQKPHVSAYLGAEVKPLLITEDVWASHLWSGDTFQAQCPDEGGNENLEYVIPSQGGELWVDGMVLLADAPNPATAHLWMNFTMRADVNAQITNYVFYATPNQASLDQNLIDEELVSNPSVFPAQEVLDRLEFQLEIADEAVRELMCDIELDVKS